MTHGHAHNHLRRVREKRGLSQRELARAAGMYHPAIHSIESGKRTPTLRTMRKLAQALAVKITDLIE